MQLNPIIVREFRARWRSWRAFAIVLGYATLLALAVGLLYYVSVRPDDFRGAAVRRMAQIGHDMFLGLTAMQVFAWMLLAPALTATSIAGEREEGMLDLLQMSPLSPRKIVWGKILAALSFIFLMMLAPLPITALCFLMGGVSPGEFYVAVLLQSMTAIAGAVVGLFCSAWCRRASTALAIAFTIMAVWGVSSAFAVIFMNSTGRAGTFWLKEFGYYVSEVWWRTNPIIAVFASTSFGSTSFFVFSYDIPSWVCTVFFEALIAVVLLVYATLALRRPLQEPLEKEPPVKRGAVPASELAPEAALAARSTPKPRRSVWWEASWASSLYFKNPVLQREMQRKLRIRKPSRKIITLLYVLSAMGGLLYLWGLLSGLTKEGYEREIYFYLPAFLLLVIVSVAAAAMSATAFPRERESHTWESLRLSLLTPRQIIMGKLMPPLIACWTATMAAFLLLSPCIVSWTVGSRGTGWRERGLSFTQFVSCILVFCGVIWCYSCWGLLVSWWCRRSWIAVTTTIASLIFLLTFIPLFLLISVGSQDSRMVTDFMRLWHPFFTMSSIAEQNWRGPYKGSLIGVVVPYIIVMAGAGCGCLALLYREMMHSMREAVGWNVRMDT